MTWSHNMLHWSVKWWKVWDGSVIQSVSYGGHYCLVRDTSSILSSYTSRPGSKTYNIYILSTHSPTSKYECNTLHVLCCTSSKKACTRILMIRCMREGRGGGRVQLIFYLTSSLCLNYVRMLPFWCNFLLLRCTNANHMQLEKDTGHLLKFFQDKRKCFRYLKGSSIHWHVSLAEHQVCILSNWEGLSFQQQDFQ